MQKEVYCADCDCKDIQIHNLQKSKNEVLKIQKELKDKIDLLTENCDGWKKLYDEMEEFYKDEIFNLSSQIRTSDQMRLDNLIAWGESLKL